MTQRPPFEISVSPEESGVRIDRFLSRKLPEYSRNLIHRWLVDGQIRLNGKAIKPSYQVKAWDQLLCAPPPLKEWHVTAEKLPLEILHEDSDLVVLNKPAEWVVHPGAGNPKGTLVNALLYHCRTLSGVGGVLRPGIVHRLDKGTSGVLVVAKNDFAHQKLSEQFSDRKIRKIYLAFVWGQPRSGKGIINVPLGRSLKNRKKIGSQTQKGREAETHYQVVHSWGPISLLELTPKTGRTHQIRVHLAELGHPIVGDPLYGRGLRRMASLPEALQDQVRGFSFQLLHAHTLVFQHPKGGGKKSFTVPMRKEMADFQAALDKWLNPAVILRLK